MQSSSILASRSCLAAADALLSGAFTLDLELLFDSCEADECLNGFDDDEDVLG